MPEKQLDSKQWHNAIIGDASPEDIAGRISSGQTPEWLKPVLELSKPGDSVLEFGSGTGLLSGALAKNGRSVTLIDYSPDSIEFCKNVFKSAGLDACFLVADVLNPLPIKDSSFDCVWSGGLLEHFTDEDITRILKESCRISRKYVVSLVPNAYSCAYRAGKWYQEKHGLWSWGAEGPKGSLKPLFKRSGLKNVSEYTIAPKASINFLAPVKPVLLAKIAAKLFNMIPDRAMKALKQGYLLVTIGEK